MVSAVNKAGTTASREKKLSPMARLLAWSRKSYHEAFQRRQPREEGPVRNITVDGAPEQGKEDGREELQRRTANEASGNRRSEGQPDIITSISNPVPNIVFSASTKSLQTIGDSPLFLAGQHIRSVSTGDVNAYEPSSEVVHFDLLKHWIKTCEEEHGEACALSKLAPTDTDGETRRVLQIILVDVKQLCLVESTTAARYFALSYVWGGVQQLRTRKAFRDSLQKPFALQACMAQIPQVIKDAIALMKSLDERYLWIDSLSIVEDDAEVKHHQISHMSDIYSHAVVTIIAVAGQDANARLPGVTPDTRWPRYGRSRSIALSRPLRPDLASKAVDRSVYVSRGWTFQERLLSRRALYFLDEQVYFQCQRELWCEEAPLLQSFIAPSAAPMDMGLNILASVPGWVRNMEQRRWGEAFRFYAAIVEEYTRKQLSYPSDVLKAFSGTLSVLQQYSGWTFAAGMPEQFIESALLWIPKHSVTRRENSSVRTPGAYFPSWSWAGWMGEVSFDIIRIGYENDFDDHASIYAHKFSVSTDGENYSTIQGCGIENPRWGRIANSIDIFKNLSDPDPFNYRFSWLSEPEIKETLSCMARDLASMSSQSSSREFHDPDSIWLKFRTSTISLDGLHFSALPHMSPNPDVGLRSIGTYPGTWILSNSSRPDSLDLACGFLYGVHLFDLKKHNKDDLLLALISATWKKPCVWKTIPDSTMDWLDRSSPRRLPWSNLDALLIVKSGDCFERVGVCQINQTVWEISSPKDMEIVLV